MSGYSEEQTEDGLRYETSTKDGRLLIRPTDPYLDHIRNTGVLEPLDYWWTPWEHTFHWPMLDIKIANNTGDTIFFHEALFRVESSQLDPRPVPLIAGVSYDMSLPLVNAGWGPMTQCTLRFFLLTRQNPRGVTTLFEWNFDELADVSRAGSLAPYMEAAGVDVGMLERLADKTGLDMRSGDWRYLPPEAGLGEPVSDDDRFLKYSGLAGYRRIPEAQYLELRKAALGPFAADSEAWLAGQLEYTQTELSGEQTRKKHPIATRISFDRRLPGAPIPPTGTYQVKLRSMGRDYAVSAPISQALAAGEVDRFLFRIAADRSSLHDFSLALRYNNDEIVIADAVKLELFFSTLDAAYHERQARERRSPAT